MFIKATSIHCTIRLALTPARLAHDSMDGGGRAKLGARAERLKSINRDALYFFELTKSMNA